MAQLISKREASDRVGFHPVHIMRLAKAGKFPKPVKMGEKTNSTVRFVAEEVDGWLAARVADRK